PDGVFSGMFGRLLVARGSRTEIRVPASAIRSFGQVDQALVVDGDRNGLAITFASHKVDPWGGVAKGLKSDWRLVIRDARGELLAEVPLDVSQFATNAADVGRARRVEGCIVIDSHIAMLVNAPTFAAAASYEFYRGDVRIGRTSGDDVRRLAGGGR
ncbi:MAG: hypothetical protein KDC48_06705, partial [Planctomycetes bacterium]|nr:hypothetical protein [Planctomycetota bacterium]